MAWKNKHLSAPIALSAETGWPVTPDDVVTGALRCRA
jgi:hypothetical protein